MDFYSQYGEDAVICAMFNGKRDGYFAEIGCIDGRRFSTTLALEELGWRGLCVEAHTDYIDMLRANRPNSAVVHAAIGPHDADGVTLYANARGTLSTLDPDKEEDDAARFGEYFTGYEQQIVPMRTVSSVLDEVGNPDVDVMTIDIEGGEVGAITGMDLTRHRPRVLIMEVEDRHVPAIESALLPAGYQFAFSIGCNRFYVTDRQLVMNLSGRKLNCRLRHTLHPLDTGEDQFMQVALNFGGLKQAG